ncbi:MAG: hypothetical protein VR70_08100 [Rhodospirillaceae bacterium BRH_c57]|nr:MAG: hypothetical protein VR70_08100 [Rhodospirillaceae bacterium BRH_c57]
MINRVDEQLRQDHRIAETVRHELREGGCRPGGHREARLRKILVGDADLAAFITSVQAGGEPARAEERDRVRQYRLERLKKYRSGGPKHRGDSLPTWAVAELIPLWRDWGRLIRDAQLAGQ